MKIGIDARMLGSGFGLARYVEQLVTLLEKHDTEHEYVIFLRKENWNSFVPTSDRFTRVLADIPWYSVKEQLCLSRIIGKQKIDLMHFPHWNVPLVYTKPFVVTIHDLIMFHYPRPEATTRGKIMFWIKDIAHRMVLRHAVKYAKHIITTSEFTAQDVVKTLGVNREKMTCVYQAPFVAEGFLVNDHGTHVLNKHGIQKKYVMYVGAAYPHKNVENLLRAWQMVHHDYDEYQLVLVGNDNYFWQRLRDSDLYQDTPQVVHTGYVSDHELATLYEHAALYVFPSLYEGFGLPPLEAMASNVPVASSYATCLPEVLGEAAMYFDPENIDHMAGTIMTIISNPDIQMQLQQAGRERLRELSGEKFVRETRDVYQRIAGSEQWTVKSGQ